MALSDDPKLFYALVGVSAGLALLLLLLICWCLAKRRQRRKIKKSDKFKEKVELSSTASMRFSTGLAPQQMPAPFHIPSPDYSRSSPNSPQHSPNLPRRHSLDPKAFDIDMYRVEEERSRMSPYIGLGRLCFSVFYDSLNEKLIISLIKGAKLPSKSGSLTPSPYIKIYLLPDKKRKHQSRTVKGNSPEFHEEFVFTMPETDFETRVVKFVVCDYDRFSRTSVIGYVLFPLHDRSEEIAQAGGTGELWREITEDEVLPGEDKGELLFSMSHLPTAGRLTINIIKGKGIRTQEREHGATLAVKVSMISGGKPIKTKKATARRGDLVFPVFNDTFVFDVTDELMDRLSFVLAVCVYPRGGAKKVVGRVIVGPYMYATGDGLEHWKEMLINPRHSNARWHKIV